MPATRSRIFAAAGLAVGLVIALIGPATAGPSYQRLYYMGAETDYLYWSVDPSDPELGSATISRTCGLGTVWGIQGVSKPCLRGINPGSGYTYNMYFLPASALGAPVSWDAANPLKFHLELTAESPVPYTVHLTIQKGTSVVESPAATQVSPGVWEGTVTSGAPIDPLQATLLGVRVRTLSERVTMQLKARGASYIELPQAVPAHSVADLQAQDSYQPAPSSLTTGQRSFTFNDENWSVQTFEGTLRDGSEQGFAFAMGRDAEFVLAWVEAYDSPFTDDVLDGRSPDSRKLTDSMTMELRQNGDVVETGGNPFGGQRGMDALGVMDLPAGDVELRVKGTARSQGYPYKAYVLAVHGARTLRSMRWTFTENGGIDPLPASRLPVAGVCPASVEPVPVTSEVTTYSADIDWESHGLPPPRYTLRFQLPGVGDFPCSEAGTGDRVRFTVPGERVAYLGATPAYDATFYPPWDVVFRMEVRYTYSPPPQA
jgi:hypothetical protein